MTCEFEYYYDWPPYVSTCGNTSVSPLEQLIISSDKGHCSYHKAAVCDTCGDIAVALYKSCCRIGVTKSFLCESCLPTVC